MEPFCILEDFNLVLKSKSKDNQMVQDANTLLWKWSRWKHSAVHSLRFDDVFAVNILYNKYKIQIPPASKNYLHWIQ